jgi:hypothetical protein
MTRLCRLCGERPVAPSRQKARDYRCTRCRRQTPSQQAACKRWRQTPSGRATDARTRARRIFVGQAYHSVAATAEDARALNLHIRERRRAFIKGQPHREETEGATPGRVPTETAV